MYINGESKTFPCKLVITNEFISIQKYDTRSEIYRYGFQDVKKLKVSKSNKHDVSIFYTIMLSRRIALSIRGAL